MRFRSLHCARSWPLAFLMVASACAKEPFRFVLRDDCDGGADCTLDAEPVIPVSDDDAGIFDIDAGGSRDTGSDEAPESGEGDSASEPLSDDSGCGLGTCACGAGLQRCDTECVPIDDVLHCGACNNRCATEGAVCTRGECGCPEGTRACHGQCVALRGERVAGCLHVLATAAYPAALASDGQDVYVATWTELLRIAASTGERAVLAPLDLPPISIAFSDTDVLLGGVFGLAKVPREGGELTVLARPESSTISALSADATSAYYMTNYNIVRRVPLDGGSASLVSSGPYSSNVSDMTLVDDTLYFSNLGVWRSDYVARVANSAFIAKAAVTATDRTVVLAGLAAPPSQLVSDGVRIYWTDGALNEVSVDGGDVTRLVPDVGGDVIELLIDGSVLYWATAHAVYAMARDAVGPELVADKFGRIVGLTQSADTLYFVDGNSGDIVEIAK